MSGKVKPLCFYHAGMQLHVLALLGLIVSQTAAAQAVTPTQAGQWTYEVKADALTKTNKSSRKVIWSNTYALKNPKLIDVKEDALVIVGIRNRRYLVAKSPKNIYASQFVPTLMVVNTVSGKTLWKTDEQDLFGAKVIGNVLLYEVGDSAYATYRTKIFDRLTGRKLAEFKGLDYTSPQKIVSVQAPFPAPYGFGRGNRIALDFMDLPSKKVSHQEITLPNIGRCAPVGEYDSSTFQYRISDTVHEYLYRTSCGSGYARYSWAAAPRQAPVVMTVPTMAWPKIP